MSRRQIFSAAMLIAFAVTGAAQSLVPQLPEYAKTLSELSAAGSTGGPGGSGNAKVVVVTILGDPSKPGLYCQLLKVAPHATIAAHHHAGDRIATVLIGTWRFGYGREFDKAKVHVLPVGSVYTEPSGAAHFAMTEDEPVTVLIMGTGPTTTVYENSDDSPTLNH